MRGDIEMDNMNQNETDYDPIEYGYHRLIFKETPSFILDLNKKKNKERNLD